MTCSINDVRAKDGTPSLLYAELLQEMNPVDALELYLKIIASPQRGPEVLDFSGEPSLADVRSYHPEYFGIQEEYDRPAQNKPDHKSKEYAFRLRVMTEQIESLRARLKGDTPEAERRQIRDSIRRLVRQRAAMASPKGNTPAQFKAIAMQQLEWAQGLLSGTATDAEVYHGLQLAASWRSAVTFQSLSEHRKGAKSAILSTFKEIGSEADATYHLLVEHTRKVLAARISEETGQTVTVDDLRKMVDMNFHNVLDMSQTGNHLAQHADALMKAAGRDWGKIAQRISQGLIRLSKGVDVSKLHQRDAKGKITRNLVSRFSHQYNTERQKAEAALKSAMAKTEGSSKTERASRVEAALQKYYSDRSKMEVAFDIRLFLPKDEGGIETSTRFKDADEYMAWLEKSVGKADAALLKEEAFKKYEKYKKAKQEFIDSLEGEVMAGAWSPNIGEEGKPETQIEYIERLTKDFDRRQSPVFYITQRMGERTWVADDANGDQFTAMMPKKYDDDGKETGYHDKAYENLSAKELALYDFIMETMMELKGYLPENLSASLAENFLPVIEKSWVERLGENGLWNVIKHGGNEFKNSFLSSEISQILPVQQEEGIDYSTGKRRTKPPLRFFQAEQAERLESEIAKAEKKIEDPLTPLDQIEMLKKKIERYKKDLSKVDQNSDYSDDILKGVEMFAAMALNYHYTSAVMDEVHLVRAVLSEARVIQTKGGQPVVLDDEVETEAEAPRKLMAMLDGAILSQIEGVKRREEFTTTITVGKDWGDLQRRRDIKRRMEIVETKYKNLEMSREERDRQILLLGEEWELLEGRDISLGNVLNNALAYTQMKAMGWNAPAGLLNMAFGFIANFTHAAGEQDFNEEQARRAFGIMLWSNKSTSVSKAARVMQGLGVLFEVQELASGENRARIEEDKGRVYKMLSTLKPFEIGRRTEFYIQGQSVIAQMLARTITVKNLEGVESEITLWDAYDNMGQWRADLQPSPEWSDERKAGQKSNEFSKFRDKVIQVNKRLHGNYDINSPLLIKSKVLGRAVAQFRSWMPASFNTRFGKEIYDRQLGRTVKGRYRSIGDGIKDVGLGDTVSLAMSTLIRGSMFGKMVGAGKIEEAQGFSHEDLANIRMAMKELRILMYLGIAIMAMYMGMDDDEEEGPTLAMKRIVLAELIRTAGDLTFYILPGGITQGLENPAPVLGVFKDSERVLNATYESLTNDTYRGRHPIYHFGKMVPGSTQLIRLWYMATNDPN